MIVTIPGHLLYVLCPPSEGSSRAYNVMSVRTYVTNVYVYFQVYIQVYIDIYVRVSLGDHNLGTY